MVIGVDPNELIWELQDQVQRGNQMLAWLVRKAGGNPDEVGMLPEEADAAATRPAA